MNDLDPVAWLRAQVEARLAVARLAAREGGTWTQDGPGSISSLGGPVVYDEGSPDEYQAAHIALNDPRDVIVRCEAELAVIGRCAPLLLPDPDDLDSRDDDEIMRDEALAELADDVLALLADGYRHREGWADHWACPVCGVARGGCPAGTRGRSR